MDIKIMRKCLVAAIIGLVAICFILMLWNCAKREEVFYEDTFSHAVKEKDSSDGSEIILYKPDNFDPDEAQWTRGVSLGISTAIHDGDIILIKVEKQIFAVTFIAQTLNPEIVEYDYRSLATPQKINHGSGPALDIESIQIDWSCTKNGEGVIYMDPFFLKNVPPRFQVGVPFFKRENGGKLSGDVGSVHFEIYPWKI